MSTQPEPEVFTRAFKAKAGITHVVLTLSIFVGTFAISLTCAWLIGKAFGDAAGSVAVFGAIGVTAAAHFLGEQKTFVMFNAGLRRDLGAALERRLGRNPDDGTAFFVGWAPGAGFNPKGLDTDHDLGFLSVTPEKMVYTGETVYFELFRQQVYMVDLKRDGVPIIMDLGTRTRVQWVDQYNQTNAFSFDSREGATKRQTRRNTRQLCEILQQWHQYGTVPVPQVG